MNSYKSTVPLEKSTGGKRKPWVFFRKLKELKLRWALGILEKEEKRINDSMTEKVENNVELQKKRDTGNKAIVNTDGKKIETNTNRNAFVPPEIVKEKTGGEIPAEVNGNGGKPTVQYTSLDRSFFKVDERFGIASEKEITTRTELSYLKIRLERTEGTGWLVEMLKQFAVVDACLELKWPKETLQDYQELALENMRTGQYFDPGTDSQKHEGLTNRIVEDIREIDIRLDDKYRRQAGKLEKKLKRRSFISKAYSSAKQVLTFALKVAFFWAYYPAKGISHLFAPKKKEVDLFEILAAEIAQGRMTKEQFERVKKDFEEKKVSYDTLKQVLRLTDWIKEEIWEGKTGYTDSFLHQEKSNAGNARDRAVGWLGGIGVLFVLFNFALLELGGTTGLSSFYERVGEKGSQVIEKIRHIVNKENAKQQLEQKKKQQDSRENQLKQRDDQKK